MSINYSNLFNRFIQDVRLFSYRAFSRKQLLITFIPSVLVLAVLILAGYILEISMGLITRDVAAIAEIHPLTGILSNLGIILWTVSGAVTAFAAFFFRKATEKETFRFLLSSSLLSFFLLIDDFFLVHEVLAPYYLGINEIAVFSFLGISLIAYIIKFRRAILRTKFMLLILALGFLGSSVVLDIILEPWLSIIGHWVYIIEDGAKWLGIASWCSYNINISHKYIAEQYLKNNQGLSEVNLQKVNSPAGFKKSLENI